MQETIPRLMIVLSMMPLFCACGLSDNSAAVPPLADEVKKTSVETRPVEASDEDVFRELTTIQVPLPDVNTLSIAEKRAVYFLNRAAETAADVRLARAPSDVARAQMVLSGILAAEDRVPPSIFQKVSDYSALFLLSDGPRDAWTGQFLMPRFIPGELAAAAQGALAGGVDFGLDSFSGTDLGANRLELLDQFLASLRPVLFGKQVDAKTVLSTNGDGAKGGGSPPPANRSGAEAVRELLVSLKADERMPLEDLVVFLETGDEARYAAYLREWQKKIYAHELVAVFEGNGDAVSGSGVSGRFEMIAAVMDPDRTPIVQKVAKKADYFERNLPGNAMFKRPLKSLVPPSAAAYFVTAAAPWSASLDAGAYTYPLPQTLSAFRGNKALLFLHAASLREAAFGEALAEAFSSDKDTLFLRRKWRSVASSAFLILKHVIGCQAGTRRIKSVDPGSEGIAVSGPLSILSEIHSDLVALHFAFDPVSIELGLIPEAECARAVLAQYVSRFLEQAVFDTASGDIRDRQMTAVRVVTRGLLRSGAVSVDRVDGRFYVAVRDVDAARKSVEAQLAEAQRMISLGEAGDAQSLIDTDGAPLPQAWRADAAERLRTIGVRANYAYLFSTANAKKDASGKIEDVLFTLPASLLEWTASRSRRIHK